MDIEIGSNRFADVAIPLLWGTKAVIQTASGVSVIELAGPRAQLEILAGRPADGALYTEVAGGFEITSEYGISFVFQTTPTSLRDPQGVLPDCVIDEHGITVGGSRFSGNVFSGSAVGLLVTDDRISIAAPLPDGLVRLVV